jgi:chaperonin GroEL
MYSGCFPGRSASAVSRTGEGKGNFGYNTVTGEYGDLVTMSVLDPTKVERIALQNAGSVAGLMPTTDCMVAELVEDKPAGGSMDMM